MKKKLLQIPMLALVLILGACSSDSTASSDDENEPGNLPNLEFSVTVSGAESHNFEFILAHGTSGSHAATGAFNSNLQLFSINILQLPSGWSMNLAATSSGINERTFQMNQGDLDLSSFKNPDGTNVYLSTSGSVTFTDADFFGSVENVEVWYVSGNFDITMEDNQGNEIDVTGSFDGVAMSSQ